MDPVGPFRRRHVGRRDDRPAPGPRCGREDAVGHGRDVPRPQRVSSAHRSRGGHQGARDGQPRREGNGARTPAALATFKASQKGNCNDAAPMNPRPQVISAMISCFVEGTEGEPKG